jgi:lipoate-protein ligase A
MKYLNLSFQTPEENLACDELLLNLCEENRGQEFLRFWQPASHFIVLGYSNRYRREVRPVRCRQMNVPVLRRMSGGGAVVQGPGCLNYSLVLKIKPEIKNITLSNRFIMTRNKRALEPLVGPKIELMGDTDLVLGSRKFSGNAQRRTRQAVLFHGTFLLHMDFELMGRILRVPEKQPVYRQNREHRDFLVNLNLPAELIQKNMREEWQADQVATGLPQDRVDRLVEEKYSRKTWNLKF